MQNNNETNENVSKVVADFFKKNPIKRNNAQNRRNYPKKEPVQSSDSPDSVQTKAKDNKNDFAHGRRKHHNNKFHNKNNASKRNDVAKPIFNNAENVIENTKANNSDASVVDTVEVTIPNNQSNTEQTERITTPPTDKNENQIIPGSENEWYDPEAPIEIIGVRFKTGGKIYYFAPLGNKLAKNDNVIVETARGLEFATVCIPNSILKAKDIVMPLKNVVRLATDADVKHHEENEEKIKEALRICNEKIVVHNLDMKLVDVEYTFDNSKLLFYFTSEGRVDFRELVKDLAGVFKTRIELRQIGIREETKLLGGIGICGRPFCCKTFLNDFVQVSIKMAKEQGLSLNSAKISGACGRLMCCLRYEYETYDEEIRKTPKVDTPVITPEGPGVICETQPLVGLCKVKITVGEETVIKVFHRDDLKRNEIGEDKQGLIGNFS